VAYRQPNMPAVSSLASASVDSVGKWPTTSQTCRHSAVWLQHLWSLSVSGLPPAKHAGSQLRQQEPVPTREGLVSDIPAGDGKIANVFFTVQHLWSLSVSGTPPMWDRALFQIPGSGNLSSLFMPCCAGAAPVSSWGS
jgi:hypothetical protein